MMDLLESLEIKVEDSAEFNKFNNRDVIGEIMLEKFSDNMDSINSTNVLSESISMDSVTSNMQLLNQINVAILNLFDNTSFRTQFYENLLSECSKLVLDIYYDDVVSVNDLKTALREK